MSIDNIDSNKSNEIEDIVLYNFLANPDSRSSIIVKLKDFDFLDSVNKELFIIMSEMVKDNLKLDENLLVDRIESINNLASTTKNKLIEKINSLITYDLIEEIGDYIEIIAKKSMLNQLINFCDKQKNALKLSDYNNVDDLIQKFQENFISVINNRVSNNLVSIEKIIDEQEQQWNKIRENVNTITGVSSGYHNLDKFLHGFQPGELIILAARPSIGKTALALNFAINAAKNIKETNKKIIIFSLEMSNSQLSQRMVSAISFVNYHDWIQGKATDAQIYAWSRASAEIKEYPILINDSSDCTIVDIQASLRDIAKNSEISLVVIDYLQLINTNEKSLNRNQEVSKISRTLKVLAKDLKIPVIAVAQLSRNIEQRSAEDRKPKLSDLRESGSIEQDADVVMFLDYERTQTDANNSNPNAQSVSYSSNVIADLYIAKNRNGETGKIQLNFDKKTGSYNDINEGN